MQISGGIVEVDVHGKTALEAQKCVEQLVTEATAGVYRIRVIHGYHGGTSLKRMLTEEFGYCRNQKVVRVTGGNNPGITELILREC